MPVSCSRVSLPVDGGLVAGSKLLDDDPLGTAVGVVVAMWVVL